MSRNMIIVNETHGRSIHHTMPRKVTDPKNYRLEHAECTLKKSSVAGERECK